MRVPIKNPKSGEIKEIPVGWSWRLLFLSSVFGVPLFRRRLYGWGALFLAMSLTSVFWEDIFGDTPHAVSEPRLFFFFIWCCFSFRMAANGNELTAKNYLENGWVFAEPDGAETKEAMRRWNLQAPGSCIPDNTKLKKCPFCAEDIQEAAVKCKHCGSSLVEEPTNTADSHVTEKKCPYCAEDIPMEATACKHCGSTVSTSLETQEH